MDGGVVTKEFLEELGIARDENGQIGKKDHLAILNKLYDELHKKVVIYTRAFEGWLDGFYFERVDRNVALVYLDLLNHEKYDIRNVQVQFSDVYKDENSYTYRVEPGNETYVLCYRSMKRDVDDLIYELERIMIKAHGREEWKNQLEYVEKDYLDNLNADDD